MPHLTGTAGSGERLTSRYSDLTGVYGNIQTPSKISGTIYNPDVTFGVDQVLGTSLQSKTTFLRQCGRGELNKQLLSRSKEILDIFETEKLDPMDVSINFNSLKAVVLELWRTAAKSSQFHQDILAILESALLALNSPEKKHISLFREAIIDLGQEILSQPHVDVIRHRFIKEGFTPLAIMSLIEDKEESDDGGNKTG